MGTPEIQATEVEELRKDAERYRWLTFDHAKHETRVLVYQASQCFNVRDKVHIDAAIDAAISKSEMENP